MAKHWLVMLFITFCLISRTFAGESVFTPSLKFGKPSIEELSMTTYAEDTTASAVILFDIGKSSYSYSNNEFTLITEQSVKIKILKAEGKKYADISIPYYVPTDGLESRETIYGVEANAYNLENGKMVKTSTKNDFIVRERLNEQYMHLKISLPAVREGTVIEYTYKKSSEYYLQLEDWVMQAAIPVVYSEYDILIPSLFIFNIEIQGRDRMEVKEGKGNYIIEHTSGSGLGESKQNLIVNARKLTFTARNLPALPDDENFLWCSHDYKTNISFELGGVMQGKNFKSYTQTWDDIDKTLLDDSSENFGQRLLLPNPFHNETITLQLSDLSVEKKIEAIFHLLKQKMSWDGSYRFHSRNPNKAIANGTGSNADLNFILISMLREIGIEAFPVVLRQRHMGRLPYNYPSLQKLSTFVVGIYINEEKNVYIDCSMDDAYFNTLPTTLAVEKARIIDKWEINRNKWVDFTQITSSAITMAINASLTPEQKITGTREAHYTGYPAVNYIRQYRQAKDSTEYISLRETQDGCQITTLSQDTIDILHTNVKETISFTKDISATNEKYIYLNPMLFMHIIDNPFKQSERIMPIDLSYIQSYTVVSNITLPEGYEIEEIPKSQTLVTDKQGIRCQYSIQALDRKLTMIYKFSIKQLRFNPEEYTNLQTIWAATVEKNNALVILKKL